MKHVSTRLRHTLVAVMVAGLATALAACGSTAGNDTATPAPNENSTPQTTSETGGNDGASEMSGMEDMGGMSGMEGMDQSGTDMASMLTSDGEYSDERFVDLMIPHHEGAVEMAKIALEGNAKHPEIEELSQEIIRTQNAEIEELESIRQEEFGTNEAASDVSEEDMAMMRMMDDPQAFADSDPFDLAFIEGMVPHHESAIEMAEVALENSDSERIRALAEQIISAQEAEISEMQSWREEWYPNS